MALGFKIDGCRRWHSAGSRQINQIYLRTHQGILHIIDVVHLVEVGDEVEHAMEGRLATAVHAHGVELRVRSHDVSRVRLRQRRPRQRREPFTRCYK